jgi:hypothetical protein
MTAFKWRVRRKHARRRLKRLKNKVKAARRGARAAR